MALRTRIYLVAESLFLTAALISGCLAVIPSNGGGQVSFTPPRSINPSDIALPNGYSIEAVATELIFPSGVTFDADGRVYVIEAGYSYGEVWTEPCLLRIERNGAPTVIARGEKNGPWTGVTFYDGNFYVAEGGELNGGRILRISANGAKSTLVENLPSRGDHHTNGPVIGADGQIYFGQGTYTNSGIVGEDNAEFGWLKRFPSLHDIPCKDIRVKGQLFDSRDPLNPDSRERIETGAFSPFGKHRAAGEIVPGSLPCNGAIMKVSPKGGQLELAAWGFRNPFALAFSPAGTLFVIDNSYDTRGSRPVHGAGDLVWAVSPGTWYGWPDFHGSRPLNQGDHFQPFWKERPEPLLSEYPNTPPPPAAILDVHSSSTGIDFSRTAVFGHSGDAFVAQFGDQAPATGKVFAPVGFKVVRIDVKTGVVHEFAVNEGHTNGPASWQRAGGLERPIALRFDPKGTSLYVVDFGVMTMGDKPKPYPGTGVLWRIFRNDQK